MQTSPPYHFKWNSPHTDQYKFIFTLYTHSPHLTYNHIFHHHIFPSFYFNLFSVQVMEMQSILSFCRPASNAHADHLFFNFFSTCHMSSVCRVSSLWKNHGNLENEKNFFQTWKNHGIWKNQPGKIMEFCQWFETLWIKIFKYPLYMPLYNDFSKYVFVCCDQSVHELMWCFRSLFLFIFIRYLYPGKTKIFLEKSWKNHGIRFRNSAGNPADVKQMFCTLWDGRSGMAVLRQQWE